MNWYKSLRLATQLNLDFALVALVAVLVGLFGIRGAVEEDNRKGAEASNLSGRAAYEKVRAQTFTTVAAGFVTDASFTRF